MKSLENDHCSRKQNFLQSRDEKKSEVGEEDFFNNKLTNMGKIPRKKLTQLARTFFSGKKFPLKNSSRSILCDEEDDTEKNNF